MGAPKKMGSGLTKYHRHYQGSGHVWQGRFKAFPVPSDDHYLTVQRYVDRNPLRAKLVARSQDWEWSSLKPTVRSSPEGLLTPGPIEKPSQWTRLVNGAQSEAELSSLRHSVALPLVILNGRHQPPKNLLGILNSATAQKAK
jgi:putative transposase